MFFFKLNFHINVVVFIFIIFNSNTQIIRNLIRKLKNMTMTFTFLSQTENPTSSKYLVYTLFQNKNPVDVFSFISLYFIPIAENVPYTLANAYYVVREPWDKRFDGVESATHGCQTQSVKSMTHTFQTFHTFRPVVRTETLTARRILFLASNIHTAMDTFPTRIYRGKWQNYLTKWQGKKKENTKPIKCALHISISQYH